MTVYCQFSIISIPKGHTSQNPLSIFFLGQNLSMEGVQVSMEDGSVERSLFLGVFSMLQHGWTWHHTVGLLEVLMWLYRLRCLLGAFPEPLGNYSIFPHETFDNYSICIFKWGLQWLFLQSSATAYLTFTYEALPTFLQSLIPILIHSFIPIRLRMVLFFRVNPNWLSSLPMSFEHPRT